MAGELVVRSVEEIPWGDVERVFGTRGDPAGCWCQYFKLSNSEWNTVGRDAFKAALCDQVQRGSPSPGLVAYLDDEPVGWVAVEPRRNYPGILRSRVVRKASTESPDDDSVWAVTCFVVRLGFRRRGVSIALMSSAVEHARAGGARLIEGYPVDVAAKQKVSSAELYHGTLSLFENAGFGVVTRPLIGRALVTLELTS